MNREEVLQRKLITLAGLIQQARLELGGNDSSLLSFHFCPDGAWISLEHENIIAKIEYLKYDDEIELNGTTEHRYIARKSPACITILTKI